MSRLLPSGWIDCGLSDAVDVFDFEREPVNRFERAKRVAAAESSEQFPYFGATGQVGWINGFRSQGERVLLGEDGAPFLDRNKSKAFIARGSFWVNNHAHVLKGACGLVDNRFLCYQLNAVDYSEYVSGTTRLKLTNAAMCRIRLALPPLNEQSRIADKVDELLSDLDAGVAELKAAQKKLAKYRQSLRKSAVDGALTASWRLQRSEGCKPSETGAQLLECILIVRRKRWEVRQRVKPSKQGRPASAVSNATYVEPKAPDLADSPVLPSTWCWASLDMTCEIQGGIQKQPSRTPLLNRFPFLRVANVARGRLELNEIHEIELFGDEIDRLALVKGDILIVEGNGSRSEIGRCARWDGSIPNAVHQNHLIRARPLLIAPELIEAWLNSINGIEKMAKLAATTSGLYTLSVGKLSKIPVPVPPLDEQDELLRLLADASAEDRRLRGAIERAMVQAAAQRQNILKTAFSGQLVPQDPDDEPASVLLARIRAERAARPPAKAPRGRKAKAAA